MLTLFRLVTKTAAGEIAQVFTPRSPALVALPFTPGADHFFEIWTDAKQDDGEPLRPFMARMKFDWPIDNGVQPVPLPASRFDVTIGGVEVKGVTLTGARWPLPMATGEWCIRNRFSNSSLTTDVNFSIGESVEVIKVEKFKGVFVRAPNTALKPEVSEFEIDTDGGKVTRGGFNAAGAWTLGGEKSITHNSGAAWRISVQSSRVFSDIMPGVDLAPYIVNGARLSLRSGTYTLSRTVNVRDVIIVGAGPETLIQWTGDDLYPGTKTPVTLIQASDSAFWRFTIDSTRRYGGSDPAGSDRWRLEKEQRPRCFALDDDCVVAYVEMIDFNRCCALGGGKARRLIQGCLFGETTRTYGVWFEGSDIAIYDNVGMNSIFEHICRGGPSNPASVYGWEFVAIDSNLFTNADNRPADPQDDGKGTIVMQAGRFGYRRKNNLLGVGGPSGVGPLSVGAGAPAHQRTTCVVIDGDRVARPVEIWPGAEDIRVIDTPIAPRMPHNLTGVGADPRRIVGLKTNYALSQEQSAIINTAPAT